MIDNILFCLIFTSQIYLVSYLYPRSLQKRMRYVLDNYPASEYPKLYPRTMEREEKVIKLYRVVNQINVVIGIALLLYAIKINLSAQGESAEMFPWYYFMLQMLPVIFIEIYGFAYAKQMRSANHTSERKAELKPRRASDYIPLTTAIMVLVFYIAAIVSCIVLYKSADTFTTKAIGLGAVLSFGHCFMGAIIGWYIYGKKLNPHQSQEDRNKEIRFSATTIGAVCIAMNAFFIITVIGELNDISAYKASIMSIYCQLLILLTLVIQSKSLRVEDLNFDVYRSDKAHP